MKRKLLFLLSLLLFVVGSCEKEPPTYKVSFNSNGGTTVVEQLVQEGANATKPASPTKESCEFEGWYSDSGLIDEWNFSTDEVRGNITLYAKWSSLFTISFDINGGSEVTKPENQSVKDGDKAIEPTEPQRSGYKFDGWYNGSEMWDFDSAVTSDIELVAMWIEELTVTFDIGYNGGESPANQQLYKGDMAIEPAQPSRDGYSFDGWFYDGELWDFKSVINSSMTITAKWTEIIIKYDVTFNLGYVGGDNTPDNQTVIEGEKVVEPTEPQRDNHLFLGWYSGDDLWSFDNTVTANVDLTAQWRELIDGGFQVLLDYNYDGAPITDTLIVKPNNKLVYDDPIRDGYSFDGWYSFSDVKWDMDAFVTDDMFLMAKWIKDAIRYSVEVFYINPITNEAAYSETFSVEEGGKLVEPELPAYEGYRFSRWMYYKESGSRGVWNFDTDVVTENLSIMGSWDVLQPAVVTFKSGSEEIVLNQYVGDEIEAPVVTPPTSEHHLIYWHIEGNESAVVTFPLKVTEDIVYVAKWEIIEIKPIDVHFNIYMDGVYIDYDYLGYIESIVVNNGELIPALTQTPKSFTHTFVGWRPEGTTQMWDFNNDKLNVIENDYFTLESYWEPIKTNNELYIYINSFESYVASSYTTESWFMMKNELEKAMFMIEGGNVLSDSEMSDIKAKIKSAEDALEMIVYGDATEIVLIDDVLTNSDGNVVLIHNGDMQQSTTFEFHVLDDKGAYLINEITQGSATESWMSDVVTSFIDWYDVPTYGFSSHIVSSATKTTSVTISSGGVTKEVSVRQYSIDEAVTLFNERFAKLPSASEISSEHEKEINALIWLTNQMYSVPSSVNVSALQNKVISLSNALPYEMSFVKISDFYILDGERVSFTPNEDGFPYGTVEYDDETVTITKSGDNSAIFKMGDGSTGTAEIVINKKDEDCTIYLKY